ncbi:oligosaccharide flippase family protein [Fictibacillus sp. KU28468]|uniref:oligosaccharide flippase family protein n=1 Tax=Fictibacillus sp. KU28468 TaxID=2991053 RepID=UPI00223DE62A|nr:oligosaccharide flippase family protein [Fictibacillus sp. KU28468]UZJ79342.1 oligosaccharide flippase family protein [Fictibacillus sp. KU28468]
MKKILQNYFYNLSYQLLTMVLPFLTIPYITRVLGSDNLGIEAYTTSVTSIFIAFATAGTNIYATRMVANIRDNPFELIKSVYNLIFLRCSISIIVIILFLLLALNLEYRFILALQLIFLLASTVLDFSWYFTGKERFREITTRNLFMKIIGFMLTITLVKDSNDLDIYVFINGITLLVPNVYFLKVLIRELGFPKRSYFSFINTISLLKNLIPFFLLTVIIQIYMNLDKIVLECFGLTKELGVYSQIIKSFNVFLSPITAFGTILMPYVSNLNYHNSKKNLEKIIFLSSNTIIILGIPIFFGLLSISRQFVHLYFGPEFIEYILVFKIGCILILTGTISNIVINQVIFPKMQEGIYLKALVSATVLRLVMLLISLNKYGIYAAMISYVFSELFLLIACSYKIKKQIAIAPIIFNKNILKILSSGIIMLITIMSIKENIFLNIIIGSMVYIFALLMFKEMITLRVYIYIKRLKLVKYLTLGKR